MDADTWDATDDWAAMLRAVPEAPGHRKLRLWCVAWERGVLSASADPTTFAWVRGWFTPDQLAGYGREVDAAEAFADGRMTRAELHAAKHKTGGPWNLFHLASGISRLIPARIVPTVNEFVREFRTPTHRELADLLREVWGNPFRPVAFDPAWRTEAVVALAQQMYEARDFGPMPVLADALDDAGCANAEILAHCRGPGPHVRGCWVVDLVLGKA